MSLPDPETREGLKRRLRELEQEVASLESRLARGQDRQRGGPSSPLSSLTPLLPVLLAVVLAAIPAVLVIRDRWSGIPWRDNMLDRVWQAAGLRGFLAYPPYMVAGLLCLVGVFVLVMVLQQGPLVFYTDLPPQEGSPAGGPPPLQKKIGMYLVLLGALTAAVLSWATRAESGWMILLGLVVYFSGWVAREFRWGQWKMYWKEHEEAFLTMALTHASFTLVLADRFGDGRIGWIAYLLVGISLWRLLRLRERIPVVFWIVNLGLMIGTFYINAWWFSVVGDEFSFYNMAREVSTRYSFTQLGQQLFSGTLVYGSHPFFSSLLQAIFMKLYGTGNFGWRFSNVYLVAVAAGLMYSFVKGFTPRILALICGFLLTSSAYLLSFSKIGYNNLQSYFVLAVVLAAAGWAVRRQSVAGYVLTGLAMGLCFYTFPGALYVLPLPLILLALFDLPINRAAAGRWGSLGLTVLLAFMPLVVQPSYFESKIAGTFLINAEITASAVALLRHLGSNFIYALFSFLYIPNETHFVSTSYADPASAVFIALGLAYVVKSLRGNRFAVFVFTAWLILLLLVGTTHDRQFPSTTRMFLLVPWYALFAAIGIYWLVIQVTRRSRALPSWIITLIVLLIMGAGYYQAYHVSPFRTAQYGSLDSLTLRMAQDSIRIDPEAEKTFFFVGPVNWNSDSIARGLEQISGISTNQVEVDSASIIPKDPIQGSSEDEITGVLESNYALVQAPYTVTVIHPSLDQGTQQALGRVLTQMGRTSCEMRRLGGDPVFAIWHSEKLQGLCNSTNMPP